MTEKVKCPVCGLPMEKWVCRGKLRKTCSPSCNMRKWRKDNPEKARKWRKDNPEKVRDAKRKWQRANLEKGREVCRKWQKANPEKAGAAYRKWKVANRGKAREGAFLFSFFKTANVPLTAKKATARIRLYTRLLGKNGTSEIQTDQEFKQILTEIEKGNTVAAYE